ncbi:MAG: archaeal heat shock protein Hsp20 [Candidatus Micrarchaeota archaeon]
MFGKKKKGWDDDDDDPFSGMFGDDFSDMINKIMKDMQKNFQGFGKMDEEMMRKAEPGKPITYGFSMNIGPDGKIKVDNFGNMRPAGQKVKVNDKREPLVDVIEKEKEITVLAELPGVEKQNIHARVVENGEYLEVNVPEKFYKKMKLPAKVDAKVSKAHYKNGVLEVTLTKKQASLPKPAGNEIKIE